MITDTTTTDRALLDKYVISSCPSGGASFSTNYSRTITKSSSAELTTKLTASIKAVALELGANLGITQSTSITYGKNYVLNVTTADIGKTYYYYYEYTKTYTTIKHWNTRTQALYHSFKGYLPKSGGTQIRLTDYELNTNLDL